jgi:archaellum component FlaF (FlaF/FlaG flagellin family)
MKISCLTLLVLIPTGIYAQNNSATVNGSVGATQATAYHVTECDADSRVWERMTYDHSPSGQVVTNVHRYTELATGLNHLVNGQWVESKEEVDILPDGTAAATNGQHQAYFPGDIYNGEIELVTPDGKQLYTPGRYVFQFRNGSPLGHP